MSNPCQAAAILIITAALAACSSMGPGGVAYSTADSPGAKQSAPPRSIDHPTGATAGEASGTVSGSMVPSGTPVEKKEQRGNTPPGMDRDGHGPADGAIVDPTGAATRGKPY
jgi:hypothetical protein